MATKKEKILGTIIGAGVGGFIASNQQLKEKDNPELTNDFWFTFKGALLGAFGGYGLSTIFGTPNNTVNYTHYLKGKRVYEGVTYSDRFLKRMKEHKANGKIFTRVAKDEPKPRVEALELERERIKTFRPINNIQHNKETSI